MPSSQHTILHAIGNTPLVEITPGIWAKCEFLNPSGSIKARLAYYMVERAEREGLLRPGHTIVEATSGNTGNAFSLVAAVKGYHMKVIMPSGFSVERVAISKGFGAEVIQVGHFDVTQAVAYAKKLGEQPGHWCPQQFDSEWNVEENNTLLGNEILSQLPKGLKLDAVVQGVGTGGTLVGVGQALKQHHNPNIAVCAMEPDEARLIENGEFREHLIEGIADGFVPGIVRRYRHTITRIVSVKGADAVAAMFALAKRGYFVGPSSGANFLAAQQLQQQGAGQVLTFFCDKGEKYLQQHFGAGSPLPATPAKHT